MARHRINLELSNYEEIDKIRELLTRRNSRFKAVKDTLIIEMSLASTVKVLQPNHVMVIDLEKLKTDLEGQLNGQFNESIVQQLQLTLREMVIVLKAQGANPELVKTLEAGIVETAKDIEEKARAATKRALKAEIITAIGNQPLPSHLN